MGKIYNLREATMLIWETVKITEEQGVGISCPYVFIVGAGISAPEITTANGIIKHCMEQVKSRYEENGEELDLILNKAERLTTNSAKYYSFWFEQAYKNKIHRQQYLKSIINNARISTSNLLLAQILNTRQIATTVITPNFDNHLLKSLNLLGNYDVFSANNMLDNIALNRNTKTLQIMHVHGTYEFYDCCNLENEIIKIAHGEGIKSTAGTIEEFFKSQSPIVIGYSGWEDDVIMSKLRDRLQYAALPYSLLWFCFSAKDYELLPEWLKSSDDVIFVLPEQKSVEDEVDRKEELSILPAEDVLNALITRFGFDAPNLFSNPIQYYIDLIDGFLPQNIEIFPVNAWKRRLDYIEEHLGDIERQIISLDAAAARKDIVDITKILKGIDYNFIPTDDMEHIVNGVILPLISSKNRIEEVEDLLAFLDEILHLLLTRARDIIADKMLKYLNSVTDFFVRYRNKIKRDNLIQICDKILDVCKLEENCEEIALIILGIKSDLADMRKKKELQNEILERGIKKIENPKIARCMLVALSRQIMAQEDIMEYQREILLSIKEKHEENKKVLEYYYECLIDFLDKNIVVELPIEQLVDWITENGMSLRLLLHAKAAQCRIENDVQKKIEIAEEAIEEYNVDNISKCIECMDYAFLLMSIVIGKISLKEMVEQKYIERAITLCYKEEGCKYVSEMILRALHTYIKNIDSQYEKRELCRQVIDICDICEFYEDWAEFNYIYIEQLEEKDRNIYIAENERFREYMEADDKVSKAIDLYVGHDIEKCKELLIEASEDFDRIFEEKYNPALGNICFMARRHEIPEINISVLEVLDKCSWENGNAFLNINKALVYISQGDWETARKEISNIKFSLEEAVKWWGQEEVVGKEEKYLVLLLLLLQGKMSTDNEEIKKEAFWDYCLTNVEIPEDIAKDIREIQAAM